MNNMRDDDAALFGELIARLGWNEGNVLALKKRECDLAQKKQQ